MTFNLPLYKNFGAEIKQLSPDLANQLSQMYTDIATSLALGIKKDVVSGADPDDDEPIEKQRMTLYG